MPTVAKTAATEPRQNGSTPVKLDTSPPVVKQTKPQRPVLYHELIVNGTVINPDKLKISVAIMKKIMGWQTESEWAELAKRKDPSLKGLDLKFEMNDPPLEPLLTDENGDRIVCHNNLGNRPFDEKTARGYAQDLLTGDWHFNGEAFIVGECGAVESGQHRGAGLILAAQIRAKNLDKYRKVWPEEPYLTTLLVFGASEKGEVVRTLDNVRPRQLSDTIYTSETFADLENHHQKLKCSRMLDNAIDLLWVRSIPKLTRPHQTHAASFDLFERHKRLEKCVRTILEITNIGSTESRPSVDFLRLGPGRCSTCLYLMGASATDIDEYTHAKPVPSEKKIDWTNWDRALEFWRELGSQKTKLLKPVRQKFLDIAKKGLEASADDRMMILTKAWNLWVKHEPIREEDLELSHQEKDSGRRVLLDDDCFGGIDRGRDAEPDDEVEVVEVEKAKEEVEAERRRLAEATVAKMSEGKIESATPTVFGLPNNSKKPTTPPATKTVKLAKPAKPTKPAGTPVKKSVKTK